MSLSLVYKSINGLALLYISSFFKPRITHYNLRGNGHNIQQIPYISSYFHNSFSYIVSYYWNNLTNSVKQCTVEALLATTLLSDRSLKRPALVATSSSCDQHCKTPFELSLKLCT